MHRGGSSLVFQVRQPRWQLKLAALDAPSCAAWLAAFAHALPTSSASAPLASATSPSNAVRPASHGVASRFDELKASLAHLQVLSVDLQAAEATLAHTQHAADVRVAELHEQLLAAQPRAL